MTQCYLFVYFLMWILLVNIFLLNKKIFYTLYVSLYIRCFGYSREREKCICKSISQYNFFCWLWIMIFGEIQFLFIILKLKKKMLIMIFDGIPIYLWYLTCFWFCSLYFLFWIQVFICSFLFRFDPWRPTSVTKTHTSNIQ